MTDRNEIQASRQETTERPTKGVESGHELLIGEQFRGSGRPITKPTMAAETLRRLKVLGPGVLLGGIFSLWVAGANMPSLMPVSDRMVIFTWVMGGPIRATYDGWLGFHPFLGLGWVGLLLIPFHPARPCAVTGCLTAVGLLLWFFSGFCMAIAAVWGA